MLCSEIETEASFKGNAQELVVAAVPFVHSHFAYLGCIPFFYETVLCIYHDNPRWRATRLQKAFWVSANGRSIVDYRIAGWGFSSWSTD